MDKQSAAKYAQVVAESAVALRQTAAERDDALAKLAQMERRAEATKVAQAMHAKGINLELTPDGLADELVKSAERGELGQIRRAVDMVAPNMGVKIAHTSDEASVGVGLSDLERYIMGQVG